MNRYSSLFTLMVLVWGPLPWTARSSEPEPLPAVETVLQWVLARAGQESEPEREFNQAYRYTHTRITEQRDGNGGLKKREEKTSIRHPGLEAGPTNSSTRGRAYEKRDFPPSEELVKRFDFTLSGREVVNGRTALVLDFKPAISQPAAQNLRERFINRIAGQVWVDETDHVLAKAKLRLTEKVNVIGGLVGNVTRLEIAFDRERTVEGFWFTRRSNWHLAGRELFSQRTIDFQEQKTDVQKVE